MRANVTTRGNGASMRLPTSDMQTAGTVVPAAAVDENHGRVVVAAHRSDVQGLIDGIIPENLHPYIDFGRPVGREAFG